MGCGTDPPGIAVGMATGLSLGLVRGCGVPAESEQLRLLKGCGSGEISCPVGGVQSSVSGMSVERVTSPCSAWCVSEMCFIDLACRKGMLMKNIRVLKRIYQRAASQILSSGEI